MDKRTRTLIEKYVHDHIDAFHESRLANIQGLTLKGVLKNKNPYLFKAKNLNRPADLIAAILDARLSSGEETSFGGFLEGLAVYVAQITGGGQKAAGTGGIDLELTRAGIRYLVAVKSGKNWGNDDQHKKLIEHFKSSIRVLRQNGQVGQILPVEGICYGKFGSGDKGKKDKGNYIVLIGQSFWHLISGDSNFYVDLIVPLTHEAEEHAKKFQEEKDATYTKLTHEFTEQFCDIEFKIDWPALIRYVSETMPPEKRRRSRNT
ncbi:MAG: hypothetical protein QOH41_4093 [Blastocatellia bacterium]|jgi:hypothetical protein|nr:hypothetical protein [Blastocatellia bacterium]